MIDDRFSFRLLQRAIAYNELFNLIATIAVGLINFIVASDIFT